MASLFGFRPKVDERPDDEPWGQATWPPPAEAVLTGRVVELRPVGPADYAQLCEALSAEVIWAHLPTPRPTDAELMGELVESVQRRGFYPWVLRLTAPMSAAQEELTPTTVVGWSSYLEVSAPDARLEIGNTAYHPAVWGTAVNPEAKLLLLGYAFEGLGMGRVQLKTDIRNVRSQRAIAGLGAQLEGVLRRYQRRADGTMRDTVLFSITAEDWPAVRRGLEARVAAALDA